MPRVPSTPNRTIKTGSDSPRNWTRQRNKKATRRSEVVGNEYESMTEDEEDKYHTQDDETPELLQATRSSESLYEEEDLVNNVDSLNGTLVNWGGLPSSPLFTDDDSPAFDGLRLYITTPDQALSARPSPVVHELTPGLSSDMEQSPITSLSPTADSPTTLSAHFSSHTLPEVTFPNNTGSPSLIQIADFASFLQQGVSGEVPSDAVINELNPPTAVPLASATMHHTAGLVALEYTPGSYPQFLPAELNNGVFPFVGMEAVVPEHPEQPIWDPIQNFGYIERELLQHATPVLPAAAPAFPLPATAPVPPVPANVAAGQFDQNAAYPDLPYQWNYIPQTFGGAQPLAAPPPVFQQQSAPSSAVQNVFNFNSPVSLNIHNATTTGQRVRTKVQGMDGWFTPDEAWTSAQ